MTRWPENDIDTPGRTLTLVFMAMLSGENSEWGLALGSRNNVGNSKAFWLQAGRCAKLQTIQRAMQAVDAEALETKLVVRAR